LDTWFDPLYRSYNFQKADTHALVSVLPQVSPLYLLRNDQEHIVQWHPTILSKLALIPQRIMNSYNTGEAAADGTYKDGDFVIRFAECEKSGRDCAAEAAPFDKQWKGVFRGQ
jgi:mannan polymerase II complex MNN11 subunit